MKPSFTFQTKTAYAGTPVAFQLTLRSNARTASHSISITSLRLCFSHQVPEIVVKHMSKESNTLQTLDVKDGKAMADLSLSPSQTKYLQFSFTPVAQAQIEVISDLVWS